MWVKKVLYVYVWCKVYVFTEYLQCGVIYGCIQGLVWESGLRRQVSVSAAAHIWVDVDMMMENHMHAQILKLSYFLVCSHS